jgi:hypothetical protein
MLMRCFLFLPKDAPLDYLEVVGEHENHGFCGAWQEKLQTRQERSDLFWQVGLNNHMDDHHALDYRAHSR